MRAAAHQVRVIADARGGQRLPVSAQAARGRDKAEALADAIWHLLTGEADPPVPQAQQVLGRDPSPEHVNCGGYSARGPHGHSPAWNRFHVEAVPSGNYYHSLNQIDRCRQDQPLVNVTHVLTLE